VRLPKLTKSRGMGWCSTHTDFHVMALRDGQVTLSFKGIFNSTLQPAFHQAAWPYLENLFLERNEDRARGTLVMGAKGVKGFGEKPQGKR